MLLGHDVHVTLVTGCVEVNIDHKSCRFPFNCVIISLNMFHASINWHISWNVANIFYAREKITLQKKKRDLKIASSSLFHVYKLI